MHIFVTTRPNYTFPVDVDAAETIASIKRKIQGETRGPTSQQHLFADSTPLQDRLTVAECNLHEGSMVIMVIKNDRTHS